MKWLLSLAIIALIAGNNLLNCQKNEPNLWFL
jgi:hypothetical protein